MAVVGVVGVVGVCCRTSLIVTRQYGICMDAWGWGERGRVERRCVWVRVGVGVGLGVRVRVRKSYQCAKN